MVQALFLGLFLVWRLLWFAGWLWSTFSLADYAREFGFVLCGMWGFLSCHKMACGLGSVLVSELFCYV